MVAFCLVGALGSVAYLQVSCLTIFDLCTSFAGSVHARAKRMMLVTPNAAPGTWSLKIRSRSMAFAHTIVTAGVSPTMAATTATGPR